MKAHPRITSAFLAEERASLGEWIYLQEYECSFEAASRSVFDPSDIEACFDDNIRPLGDRPIPRDVDDWEALHTPL